MAKFGLPLFTSTLHYCLTKTTPVIYLLMACKVGANPYSFMESNSFSWTTFLIGPRLTDLSLPFMRQMWLHLLSNLILLGWIFTHRAIQFWILFCLEVGIKCYGLAAAICDTFIYPRLSIGFIDAFRIC